MILSELPDHARVWIYTSGRALLAAEQQRLLNEMEQFTRQWKAHGAALNAGVGMLHDRYLILAADESHSSASGCSIDSSVRVLTSIGDELGVDLFVRTLVSYRDADGVHTVPIRDFWALRKAGRIDDATEVFNSTAQTLGDLRNGGWQSFAASWHAEMWR